jgi:hypothetical protein
VREITIPHQADETPEWPGTGAAWKRFHGSALVRCGNGHYMQLDHIIDDMGGVAPSLACPHSGCSWHVHARLEGWAK